LVDNKHPFGCVNIVVVMWNVYFADILHVCMIVKSKYVAISIVAIAINVAGAVKMYKNRRFENVA
jgi:hypothetical protein